MKNHRARVNGVATPTSFGAVLVRPRFPTLTSRELLGARSISAVVPAGGARAARETSEERWRGPAKLLDVCRMEALGGKAKIGQREGLRSTYEWRKNHSQLV